MIKSQLMKDLEGIYKGAVLKYRRYGEEDFKEKNFLAN